MSPNHLAREGRRRGGICGGGARGGARGRACNPLPGGPGIMPAGITTGVRGASRDVGAEPAVISAALAKPPPKPGPDRTKGPHTPWARAVVERRKASCPLPFRGRRRTVKGAEVTAQRPFRRSISFMFSAKRKKRKEATRPATPPRSFRSRFALHVTEIGCPQAKPRAGTGERAFSPPIPVQSGNSALGPRCARGRAGGGGGAGSK